MLFTRLCVEAKSYYNKVGVAAILVANHLGVKFAALLSLKNSITSPN